MPTADSMRRTVTIDFLYLDLEVCGRCRGTNTNLETGLETVRSVLEAAGTDVRVTKTLVDSEEKARALGFISSPTLRVDGRDIAPELRESQCEPEACACTGGGGVIDCRVWVYQGKEYTEAPVPLVVDAVLSAAYSGDRVQPASTPGEVPENLLRFFRSKVRAAAASCCSPRKQASCCDPSEKASCCDSPGKQDERACACQ